MNSHNRRHFNRVHSIPSLMNSILSSQKNVRASNIQKQTTINSGRASYRYTTVALLSLRSPSEITVFPDHLIERRFLDKENYIDLDRMLIEKGGKFDLESFNMHNGLILPRRIHKYDFSDIAVIEKVKSRRPKDPLTPQEVAALASVTTRYQPSTLLDTNSTQSAHVWIDDYSHQQKPTDPSRHHHAPPQPLMPYQRLNPNQCESHTTCIKSLLPTYEPNIEKKNTDITNPKANTIPILQRLFEAQKLQKNEQGKSHSLPITVSPAQPSPSHPTSTPEVQEESSSEFCTPITPKQSTTNKTIQWLLSTTPNQKDAFTRFIHEHLKCSTTMETPTTPSSNTQCGTEDDDQQKFYSALPSPIDHQDNGIFSPTSLKLDTSCLSTSNGSHPLEHWFGTSIYTNTYPCMPSAHVLSAHDFEQ